MTVLQKHDTSLRCALFPVTWLCIADVTDGHAVEGFKDGRALDPTGLEALILIVSAQFEGKSLVQRQQMVYKILNNDLTSGILHSVRMKCFTPQQWEKKGRPASLRENVPCTISASSSDEKQEDDSSSTQSLLLLRQQESNLPLTSSLPSSNVPGNISTLSAPETANKKRELDYVKENATLSSSKTIRCVTPPPQNFQCECGGSYL